MVRAYFLDTSALVKRYVQEIGSNWIGGITDPTLITIQTCRYDWETEYQVVEIEQNLTEQAGQLVQKYPLRAYDSIQLASALKLYPAFTKVDPNMFTFVSADNRLLTVAQNEGLLVDNPINYP